MAVSKSEVQQALPQLPPAIDGDQAGHLYGVTRRTMDRWYEQGVLPRNARTRIGGVTRWRTAVLLDHINGSTTATSEGC
ncbi:MAG: DNA-binding protein [Planctomycetota bacterium]